MSLSTILDIVIGLTFVYLILSLLVSEIQEIISALLQWRAEHLKQSIEVLLSGSDEVYFAEAEKLADELYQQPFIQGLNQNAKGKVTSALRRLIHWVGSVYRLITRTRSTFGEKSTGPSYIPSDKFAGALLAGLNVERLSRLLSQSRLKQLGATYIMEPVHQTLGDLRASLANEYLLDAEVKQLEQGLARVMEDFGQVSGDATLRRIIDQFDLFVMAAEASLPADNPRRDTFFRRLDYLRQNFDGEISILIERLEPTITDVMALLDRKSTVYREVFSRLRQDDPLYNELLQLFHDTALSPKLRDSLAALAKQAQTKASSFQDGFLAFQNEVETWFDQAMERSGGVYKRNARGVSILLGITLAIGANIDSIHIMQRLSRDAALRNRLLQSSTQVLNENVDVSDPNARTFKETVQELNNAALPIGWNPEVMAKQAAAPPILFVPQKFLGWLVTGLMTSMGASFWFNALSRVVRVRSTGKSQSSSQTYRDS